MKRKPVPIVFIFSLLFILSGCQESSTKESAITEKQVISTVKKQHKEYNLAEIKILSVTHEDGEYMVRWDRESNCEGGTDYVSDKSGEITHGEQHIC